MSARDFTVDIVSAQYPCGAAWLANALLELSVPLPHLWGFETREEWDISEDGEWRYVASHLPWRQTLASLRLGCTFRFRDDIRPRFIHSFPFELSRSPRIVLVVRDPRDCLYSEWRRQRQNLDLPKSMTFEDFLNHPFFGGPISMVDMLWLHLHSWLAYRQTHPEEVYMLRFEDWKGDDIGQLRDLARWLGLSPTSEELERATEASEVTHLQTVEEPLLAFDPGARQFNRRGAPEEWRTTWKSAWLPLLGEQWNKVFAELGYVHTTHGHSDASREPLDLGKILDWRGVVDPEARAYWSDLLMCEHSCFDAVRDQMSRDARR